MNILSFLVSGCLSIFGCCFSSPVDTQEDALRIGEYAARSKWSQINYDKYSVYVDFNSNTNVWCVYYLLKGSDGFTDFNVLGGGGPEVHIRMFDGKVIVNALQK